ncbi:MAG: hypothetical protein N3H84_07425, partial [Candidatus Caldarchaeum sp.]|nr:hypothetical protein [Candidatus Caldarchaeum sp.]
PTRLTAGLLETTFARMAKAAPDAWPCWAYSNHDVIRHATRWGLTDAAIRETMKKKYGVEIAGGLAHYKGKMFRIANIGLISREKIVNTIFALGKTLQSLGLDVNPAQAVENTEKEFDRLWPG